MSGADAWADACLAADLLSVDPGLGGLCLRARAGPVRDAFLARLAAGATDRPILRMPPGIEDSRLLGGLDLAATLEAGRPVLSPGLLEDAAGRTLVLPMAERATPQLAGRLNAALDAGGDFTLVALDEGVDAEELAPDSLVDRLAFRPDLSGVALGDLAEAPAADLAAARARLAGIAVPEGLAEAVVSLAARLGIVSLRAPMLALRAARAAAALAGAASVDEAAAEVAVRLVLAPRALVMPEVEAPQQDPPPPEDDTSENSPEEDGQSEAEIPEELLLEAVRAALPPDLLARLLASAARRAANSQGSGAGDDRRSRARGRPAGAMRGAPRDGARIDLVETLRVAAPWQPLRRREAGASVALVQVRPDDFRIKRSKVRSEKVVIFAVDASGSAAFARLAETKGAIELMLGQAYVARQQVALVSFRGAGAEVLLPPTRSLVMTKRRLAALAGGGGTPLAAGLVEAMGLAGQATSRGMVPYVAVLTDGKANVALDGSGGREAAGSDATRIARLLRAAGIRSLVIDTGNRPSQPARDLATELDATYLPLPRADAKALSGALQTAVGGG